jgi:hypothetical protein
MSVLESVPEISILTSARPTGPERTQALDRRWWMVRLAVHLSLAGLPVLGISAQVFGLLSLYYLAIYVLIPLVVLTAVLAVLAPDRFDMIVLSGFLWGLLACAAYDAFRLPTIYAAHLWGDFFGLVGGWATSGRPNFVVGYLWRYFGDGGGIAVPFFIEIAILRLCERKNARYIVMLAIAYAVCPVWLGLVLTDGLAPAGHALFPLTPVTLVISLVGHLIYGTVLGIGCWYSRRLHRHSPSISWNIRWDRRSTAPRGGSQPRRQHARQSRHRLHWPTPAGRAVAGRHRARPSAGWSTRMPHVTSHAAGSKRRGIRLIGELVSESGPGAIGSRQR